MKNIEKNTIPTHSFDWGLIKWFVSPDRIDGANVTFGEVVLLPGKGHDRHNHPDSEEILYILSGEGVQTIGDGDPFPVKAGDIIYIPTAVFHSTYNAGWDAMRLLAFYNPGGAEKGLTELPDFREIPVGQVQNYTRS